MKKADYISKKAVQEYLDASIRYWREFHEEKESELSRYIIDIFQSVRVSLLGTLLPEPMPEPTWDNEIGIAIGIDEDKASEIIVGMEECLDDGPAFITHGVLVLDSLGKPMPWVKGTIFEDGKEYSRVESMDNGMLCDAETLAQMQYRPGRSYVVKMDMAGYKFPELTFTTPS